MTLMATLGIIDAFYHGETGVQLGNIIQGVRLRPLRQHPSHRPQVVNRYHPLLVFRGRFLLLGAK